MHLAFMKRTILAAAALALFSAARAVAQVDILTPVNRNSVRPNQPGDPNPATLGPGSGLHAPDATAAAAAHHQSTVGQAVILQPSDTFLGQKITPPANANLNIPPVITPPPGGGAAVWLDYAQRLIASGIGIVDVTWTLLGGGTVTVTYTVSFSPSKRPVRLYWTHQRPADTEEAVMPLQNAGPTIQFSNNYRVDLYGNSSIEVYNPATGVVGDVRLNGTELQAFSGARGQFLMVYSRYDELTAKRELMAFEIVHVLEPMSTRIDVPIGGRLLPVTRQTEQLFPMVTRGMTDETGGGEIYVYQHGAGLQQGWLWAIRDSANKAWKIEVYWQAREELDVLWPFEVCIYEATWQPESTQLYARHPSGAGNGALPEPKVLFPATLSVAAMPYQVPANHMIVENGAFYSTIGGDASSGFALMKFTSGDMVWFQAFHSVHNSNSAYFTLPVAGFEPIAIVAEEVVPSFALQQDGSTGFFYPGWMRAQDPDAPADPVPNPYNVNAYNYPSSYTPTNALDSAIFPVNAGLLNVTWSQPCRLNTPPGPQDSYIQALPAPLFIPSLPARYRAAYPQPGSRWDELPMQIVLASGKGSMGGAINDFEEWLVGPSYSISQDTPSAGPQVRLSGGPQISGDVTIEAWLRKDPSFDTFSLAQFARPSPDGTTTSVLFTVGIDDGYLSINGNKLTDLPQFPDDYPAFHNSDRTEPVWQHIAITRDAASNGVFYINGHLAGTFEAPFPPLNFQGDIITWFDNFEGLFHGVRLWSSARSWREILDHRYLAVPKPNAHLIAEYNEIPVLNRVTYDFDYRFATWIADSSGKENHLPLLDHMGRSAENEVSFPRHNPGMVFSAADLYRQPDRTLDGYNPNEEHALIVNGIAYALRCDLNQDDDSDPPSYTSEPFVLVDYRDADTGRRRMKAFQVIPENDMYRFSSFMEAGQMIQAPDPIARLQPANWHEFVSGPTYQGKSTCFKDRKGWFWAHQAGDDGGMIAYVFDFSYPSQPFFDFPGMVSPPAAGTRTKWLSAYTGRGAGWPVRPGSDPSGPSSDASATPIDYTFHVMWPRETPKLFVGDTLTNPKDGLPAIRGQLSVAILYEQSRHHKPKPEVDGYYSSVHLIDPTVARKTTFAERAEPKDLPLRSYRDTRTGYTFFSELSPLLRERLYWNPRAARGEEVQLTGTFVDRTDEFDYLLLNVLDARLFDAATDPEIVTGGDDTTWGDALTTLQGVPVVRLTDDTTPFDSLALTTDGRGAGYVTLAFNNSENRDMVSPSESIFLQVIKVVPELYQGMIDPIYSSNPLDKQMNLKYTADFGGDTGRWEFEWEYADPENGRFPDMNNSNKWFYLPNAKPELPLKDYATIGDAGVFGLSDHYVRCRYRPLDPDVKALIGADVWSGYTQPVLAEGWIKRVLKAVNPFEQRIRDYMNVALNTELSMLQQAGSPYNGNVPLNQEALNDYGLIPIYETLLREARKLSIDADKTATHALSLALLMAAGRINELYMVLGNEALADAMNPTVDLGADSPVDDFAESSIFCFQNQLPNLLDEELNLLRGRDLSWEYTMLPAQNVAPSSWPLFNRLAWNFTHDIMGGQVAYVLNYGISDLKGNFDGSLDVNDAAALYPQGHGDAYGHYLSAIKGYYYLLRHPNFGWLPQVEGILAGDTEITLSYFHEKRFAAVAAAKARTAERIVSLTHRQHYVHGATDSWLYAEDDIFPYRHGANVKSVKGRDWGVDEWATRGHLGAYYDWLTVNALLPSRKADEIGIRIIDRENTPELGEVAEIARRIQRNADWADSGHNPVGLADHAIPFDISPAEIDQGKTHFEQIYARALRALNNAAEVFFRVKSIGNALRDQNEARDFDTMVDDEEAAINRRLIEIYGTPYEDDIGPGKLYPQGYLGPDLYHFMYVDLQDVTGGALPVNGRYFSTRVDNYRSVNEQITGIVTLPIDPAMANPDYGWFGNLVASGISFVGDLRDDAADWIEGQIDYLGLEHYVNLEIPEMPVVIVDPGGDAMDGVVEYTFFVTGYTNFPRTVDYYLGEYGMPVKPPSYTGQRRVEGEIQLAFLEYGIQLFAMNSVFEEALSETVRVRDAMERLRAFEFDLAFRIPHDAAAAEVEAFYEQARQNAQAVVYTIEQLSRLKDLLTEAGIEAFPRMVGFSNDLTSIGRAALRGLLAGVQEGIMKQIVEQKQTIEAAEEAIASIDDLIEDALAEARGTPERQQMFREIQAASAAARAALARCSAVLNSATAARMRASMLNSEGDQLQNERERLRKQWSSDLNARRYRNMTYQIMRNDQLQRYHETFESAVRYCYLAARAYDYETGLLQSDAANTAGRDFMTQIVRARALGRFTRDAEGRPRDPLPGGAVGDPGLADIMYRMSANWEVLKGRLGFNNPQNETDVFSLRHELFRRERNAAGNTGWRGDLQNSWRANLRDMPEFQRYCIAADPMAAQEPGFAIPFMSTVAFRKNFFGHDLDAGDNAFDSSYFATKLRGVGVWFEGYSSAPSTGLANRPHLYIVPAGLDFMRVPIQANGHSAATRGWQVVDHALPLPYPLADSQWESPEWSVLQNLCGNEMWKIRKYPSMRAFHDSGYTPEQMSYNSRLIGRSVWNSQWWIIIPAGSLHADNETARTRFLNSVTDIKLYLKTYSFSGN